MNESDFINSYYELVDRLTSTDGNLFKVDTKIANQIVEKFSDDAVYDRDKHDPYTGKSQILDFFCTKRSLTGIHEIDSIEVCDGVHLGSASRSQLQKSSDIADCKTVRVKGMFKGEMNITDEENTTRRINATQPAKLKFDDYWVIQNDKVVYRQSDIFPDRSKSIESRDCVKY